MLVGGLRCFYLSVFIFWNHSKWTAICENWYCKNYKYPIHPQTGKPLTKFLKFHFKIDWCDPKPPQRIGAELFKNFSCRGGKISAPRSVYTINLHP